MREIVSVEYEVVSGGESTGMGDDISYTGVYPVCKTVGSLVYGLTEVIAAQLGPIPGAVTSSLNASRVAADAAVQNCIKNHGNSTPSRPPMASAGGGAGGIFIAYGFDSF